MFVDTLIILANLTKMEQTYQICACMTYNSMVYVNSKMLKNSIVSYLLNYNSDAYKSLHFWNGNESENPFLTSNFIKNVGFLLIKWQKSLF